MTNVPLKKHRPGPEMLIDLTVESDEASVTTRVSEEEDGAAHQIENPGIHCGANAKRVKLNNRPRLVPERTLGGARRLFEARQQRRRNTALSSPGAKKGKKAVTWLDQKLEQAIAEGSQSVPSDEEPERKG